MIGLVTLTMSSLQGYFYSTIITAGFCILFGFILVLHHMGNHSFIKPLTIVGINFFLTLTAFAEGLRSGSYLYFFALIFAIPYLINNNKKYNKEVVFYSIP